MNPNDNNERELKEKIERIVSCYYLDQIEYENEEGELFYIESLVNEYDHEAAIPISEFIKVWHEAQKESAQKIVYQYRYVCPICNYEFVTKEQAVECCGGDQ